MFKSLFIGFFLYDFLYLSILFFFVFLIILEIVFFEIFLVYLLCCFLFGLEVKNFIGNCIFFFNFSNLIYVVIIFSVFNLVFF